MSESFNGGYNSLRAAYDLVYYMPHGLTFCLALHRNVVLLTEECPLLT